MTVFEIDQEMAKELYPFSPNNIKLKLEEKFGKQAFVKFDWRNIKSFEDACQAQALDAKALLEKWQAKGDAPDEIAYKQLKIYIKAINGLWVPDWNNDDQRKWVPVFNMKAGFGFSDAGYYDWSTDTTVGSRLCFETEEKLLHAVKHILPIYKAFYCTE